MARRGGRGLVQIVFFGTSEFAVPPLRVAASNVALVVTQPDRPSGRGLKIRESPVKREATSLGLNVAAPEKARDPSFVQKIWDLKPDILLVASYGQILPQSLLDAARRGGINLHASLLPEYRGAAPVQRAIMDGRTRTGLTLMQMDKGMDTGDVIAACETDVRPDETAGELEARLAEMGAGLAETWLPRIASGDYPRTPQDNERATVAPKVTRGDAEIRFDMEAKAAYDRFRGCTPRPGAWLKTDSGALRIHRARLEPGLAGRAGEILAGTDLIVAFRAGALRLLEVQPEGKPKMSGRDFANGRRLREGDNLAD